MDARQIHRGEPFKRDVRHLSKKQPGFSKAIDEVLDEIAAADSPPGDQIPGLEGAPVFKLRIPYGQKGKRGGARLIYYCAERLVIALFAYSKNEMSDIQAPAIRDALEAAQQLSEQDPHQDLG